MQIPNFAAKIVRKKCDKYSHILDSLTQELQTLTVEQKQKVDDIRDRTVELRRKNNYKLQVTVSMVTLTKNLMQQKVA